MSPIQDILQDFKSGQFVILVDHPERENEGDLMLSAQCADAAKINFMMREARGLICLCLQENQVRQLRLPQQISELHLPHRSHAAFTFSIEARRGIKTGISARERAHTIQVAIAADSTEKDIVCPGHVFPLRAVSGGVLERAGHTEACVDLAMLSEHRPAGVICEILDNEGNAADSHFLQDFANRFNIKIGTVDELIKYRRKNGKR